jgi:hypothetical protein
LADALGETGSGVADVRIHLQNDCKRLSLSFRHDPGADTRFEEHQIRRPHHENGVLVVTGAKIHGQVRIGYGRQAVHAPDHLLGVDVGEDTGGVHRGVLNRQEQRALLLVEQGQERERELKLALSSDPRLHIVKDDPVAYRAALATAPKYSPTVLYQVEELLAREPVTVPRWLLGGRVTCPEADGWAPYENRQHQWFVLSPDDTLVPA